MKRAIKKYLLSVAMLAFVCTAFSQNKDEIAVLANSKRLHQIVFGNKDSVALEGLLAKTLTYGHSSGKVQNRAEAIDGIVHNKSTYTDTSLKAYSVIMGDDMAIVRYTMRETETNGEGKTAPLRLSIMLVWTKEKGNWKLIGRQAVRLAE